MNERAVSRFSWVEDGRARAASVPAWVAGVGSCALAAALAAEQLGGGPATAGAALVLVVGAVTGRALRLDQAFPATGAWMWAIGAVTAASVTVGPLTGSLWFVMAGGMFILPLDWRLVPRLRGAVGAGIVFATMTVIVPGTPRLPLLALWAGLAMLTLLLLERDTRRAGRQAANHRPPGHPAVPPDRTRPARDALVTVAVAAAAVVTALVVLPPASPEAAAGRPGQGGFGDPTYAGFGGELDTADRFALGDEIVLRVRADTPALWRGDTYERFDGRRWTQRPAPVERLNGRERLLVPRAAAPARAGAAEPDGAPATDEQVQVFTFARGGNDLVFGANRPRAVLSPGRATWSPTSDAVRLDRPLGRGGSYTVISERPRIDEHVLRDLDEARARAVAERPDDFAPYLAVPASTSPRTTALAAEVTAGSVTAIDRIRALEAWLGANMRYRLDVPPLPPGRDAVDQFLFEDRQGYCEQIASALAVLLRSLGVPTRLAVGFVPDGQDAATGEWIVRERNAHAWVEVWWPGVGWQGFDPTAEVPLAPDQGASTAGSRLEAVAPASAAAVLLLGVAGAVLARRGRARRRPRSWVEDAVARLDRAGAGAGRPRRPDETLVEYGDALDGQVLAGAGAPALGRSLSQAAFAPDGGDRTATEHALRAVEEAARRHRRGRR